MEQGTCKWFDPKKGFGFISRDGKDDIFVHWKGILGDGKEFKTLLENQNVEFEVATADDGKKSAVNVKIL